MALRRFMLLYMVIVDVSKPTLAFSLERNKFRSTIGLEGAFCSDNEHQINGPTKYGGACAAGNVLVAASSSV
jgi:hypothetical protein